MSQSSAAPALILQKKTPPISPNAQENEPRTEAIKTSPLLSIPFSPLQEILIFLLNPIFPSRPGICLIRPHSWAHSRWRLLHSRLSLLVSPHAADSTLEDLQGEDGSSSSPEDPAERREDGISTSGGTHGAPAEEELA